MTVIEKYIVSYPYKTKTQLAKEIGVGHMCIRKAIANLRSVGFLQPISIELSQEFINRLVEMAGDDKRKNLAYMAKSKLEEIFILP